MQGGLCSGSSQRGVTYLALLLAVALTSAALGAGSTLWAQTQRRERETQLLWAGGQIRKAIAAYARAGGVAAAGDIAYPLSLEDLLLDARSGAPRRFLRQVYEDPMTRSTDWGLVRNAHGRIVGVYSRSELAPLKTGRFGAADAAFERARRYADWRFTAVLDVGLADAPGNVPGTVSGDAAAPAADGDDSLGPPSRALSMPAAAGAASAPPARAASEVLASPPALPVVATPDPAPEPEPPTPPDVEPTGQPEPGLDAPPDAHAATEPDPDAASGPTGAPGDPPSSAPASPAGAGP